MHTSSYKIVKPKLTWIRISNVKHNKMLFRKDLIASKLELEKQYRELTLMLIFGAVAALAVIQAMQKVLS